VGFGSPAPGVSGGVGSDQGAGSAHGGGAGAAWGWRIVSGTAADWCLKLGKLRKSFKPSFTGLICRYASDQG
jgi:hypothetical protein